MSNFCNDLQISTLNCTIIQKIQIAQRSAGKNRQRHLSNAFVRSSKEVTDLVECIMRLKWQWAGQTVWTIDGWLTNKVLTITHKTTSNQEEDHKIYGTRTSRSWQSKTEQCRNKIIS